MQSVEDIILASQRTPFAGTVFRESLEAGFTLRELVDRVPAHVKPAAFETLGVVRIDGEIIPPDRWRLVRPKPGRVITLEMRPAGGQKSGGGKNVFALIASIALIAVAALVSGGILGGIFAAGTIGAQVLAFGITVVGQLAISALTRPPTSKPKADQSINSGVASATGNILAPGDSIPRVIGTHRVYPPLACSSLVETIGDDQYAELVMVLAGPHKLESIEIDGVSIENMPDLQVETREGWDSDEPISLVSRTAATTQPQITASQHQIDKTNLQKLLHQAQPEIDYPQWSRVRSSEAPDQIWVGLVWGQGLYNSISPSGILGQAVRMRIRKAGDTDWINFPEIHFENSQAYVFRKTARMIWGSPPTPLPTPPTAKGPYVAFAIVPGQTDAPAGDGWTAHPMFQDGTGSFTGTLRTALNADTIDFYIDANYLPQDGVFEIEVMRGAAYSVASFTTSTYQYGGNVWDFFRSKYSGGIYIVPYNTNGVSDQLTIQSVSSVYNINPVPRPGLAVIAMRGKNRAFQNISVLASGYVRDWNGTAWENWTTTSNPAPHFRDVMTGALNARPIPDAILDDDSLVEWRSYCQTYGFTVDSIMQDLTVGEALNRIASCGRAKPRGADRWGVIIDRYRADEPVTQVFSPLNAGNLTFQKAFTRLIDGFIVTFRDPTNDYAQTEIVVARDGVPEVAQNNLEAVTYEGICSETLARDRASFDLRQITARAMSWTLDVAIESLVSTRGDLVGVQSDILTEQCSYARVVSVDIDTSGDVYGLTLDQPILVNDSRSVWTVDPIWGESDIWHLGLQTGAAIRLDDGAILTKQISGAAGPTDTIAFTAPFAMPTYVDASLATVDALTTGCLLVAGPLGREVRRMIIANITPSADLGATLTLVDEAPDLTITERGVPFEGGVFFVGDVGFR